MPTVDQLFEPLIALLRAEFGEAYIAYCARTWRLVPGLY